MLQAIGSTTPNVNGAPGVAAGRANPMQGVAELLGMSPSELIEELRGGSGLTEVAAQHGVSRADLIKQVSKDLEIRFGADSSAMAEKIVDRSGPPPGRPCSGAGVEGVDFGARASQVFQPVADVLQISTETLLAQLEQGSSLNDLAKEQGVTSSSVITAAQQGLLLNAWA